MQHNDTKDKLEKFCIRALEMMGASVSQDSPGLWRVSVPSSHIELFEGRDVLRLTFDPACAGESVDLVVPGSFALERLLEAVKIREGVGNYRLRPAAGTSAPSIINLSNAQAHLESSQVRHRPLVLLVFRISLVTDENEDRLFSVVVDASTGEQVETSQQKLLDLPVDLAGSGADGLDLSIAFATGRLASSNMAREWSTSVRQGIDTRLQKEFARLDDYYQDLLNDSVKGGINKDINKVQKHREKAVEAYDETVRLYETAHELLVNARTADDLSRLLEERHEAITKKKRKLHTKIFFQDQLYFSEMVILNREVIQLDKAGVVAEQLVGLPHDAKIEKLEQKKQESLEKVKQKSQLQEAAKFDDETTARLEQISAQLESEKVQRMTELRDKFQLKVVITPLSASIFHYPVMECSYRIEAGAEHISLNSSLNLISGEMKLPSCQTCGSMPVSHLCSSGHLVCEVCSTTCEICGETLCKSHIRTCPSCLSIVCSNEMRTCVECGKLGCSKDISSCPSCEKAVCSDHGGMCQLCGQRFCRGCLNSSGYCLTCGGLFPATVSAAVLPEIVEDLVGKRPKGRGRWYAGENGGQFVLARCSFDLRVYVIDKANRRMLSTRRLGFFDSMKQKIRLMR